MNHVPTTPKTPWGAALRGCFSALRRAPVPGRADRRQRVGARNAPPGGGRSLLQRFAGERGQVLIIFAIGLPAFIGLAGLSIDVGNLLYTRTHMQSVADSAALAGAGALGVGDDLNTEVSNYIAANGGASSWSVHNPPTSGSHIGDADYVEVTVTRNVKKYFIGVIYSGGWTASARAVSHVQGGGALGNNFIALRGDCEKHTLMVQLGGTLTVDGAIYVNSGDSDKKDGNGNAMPCGNESKGPPGYGDAFDVFGTGGTIAAAEIIVHGGWETHSGDLVSPNPKVNQPIIADPLASLPAPTIPGSYTVRNGTAASPVVYTIASGSVTLNPGIYYGGILVKNAAAVTMNPGVYIMAGNGLTIQNSATLTGSGVMIYNTKDGSVKGGAADSIFIKTTGAVNLSSPTSGTYRGMLVFQDRTVTPNIVVSPGNGIGGLQGTIYAPKWTSAGGSKETCPGSAGDDGSSTTVINGSGTANVQIISAEILICGVNAHFHFDPKGLGNWGGVPTSAGLSE